MFGNGSIMVVLLVLLGTVAVIGLIRMIGVYGAATQDYVASQAATAPSTSPPPSSDTLLLVAILSAAAAIELETENVVIREIHEVKIPQSSHDWGAHGRQMIFQSHRLRS